MEVLTTDSRVGINSNMKAIELLRTRIVHSTSAFAKLVLWRVPDSVEGSLHPFKYRLAYVVNEVCVLRYDNEVGKGDHRHDGDVERRFKFTTPDKLIADVQADIAR